MRALAVTPIHLPPDEVARRQARYDRLAPPGVEIELRNVGPTAPATLDTAGSMRDSEREVAALLKAAADGFDLAFPDCVLDPSVPDAVSDPALPVHGILKLSATHLAGKGVRFGAVVRNEAIKDEFASRIAAYGLDEYLAGIRVLDLPFSAIAETEVWNAALGSAVRELAELGATAVINGCSAVDVEPADLPARIVDPTELAMRLLAVEGVR
ncbi:MULTISPECIES: aspartate/glutamate racemase family protein [unclassified Amycolatopsis]|uniref:aspartate/glutamate racemase family protein n=1 Tax=unclassified Amycolatopsis TaxID=2618356 RepID=UPI001C699711|nr:aspartate/glutamate racemase family protein [Amycolatopsis sp. DSM 110486]QYN22184.1 aspartate/glutamate racemase family protein [Amycolatopsis sp. DSM 110486]